MLALSIVVLLAKALGIHVVRALPVRATKYQCALDKQTETESGSTNIVILKAYHYKLGGYPNAAILLAV